MAGTLRKLCFSCFIVDDAYQPCGRRHAEGGPEPKATNRASQGSDLNQREPSAICQANASPGTPLDKPLGQKRSLSGTCASPSTNAMRPSDDLSTPLHWRSAWAVQDPASPCSAGIPPCHATPRTPSIKPPYCTPLLDTVIATGVTEQSPATPARRACATLSSGLLNSGASRLCVHPETEGEGELAPSDASIQLYLEHTIGSGADRQCAEPPALASIRTKARQLLAPPPQQQQKEQQCWTPSPTPISASPQMQVTSPGGMPTQPAVKAPPAKPAVAPPSSRAVASAPAATPGAPSGPLLGSHSAHNLAAGLALQEAASRAVAYLRSSSGGLMASSPTAPASLEPQTGAGSPTGFARARNVFANPWRAALSRPSSGSVAPPAGARYSNGGSGGGSRSAAGRNRRASVVGESYPAPMASRAACASSSTGVVVVKQGRVSPADVARASRGGAAAVDGIDIASILQHELRIVAPDPGSARGPAPDLRNWKKRADSSLRQSPELNVRRNSGSPWPTTAAALGGATPQAPVSAAVGSPGRRNSSLLSGLLSANVPPAVVAVRMSGGGGGPSACTLSSGLLQGGRGDGAVRRQSSGLRRSATAL